MKLHNIDINNAYCQSYIDTDVYVHVPDAYELINKNVSKLKCLKLNKSLYGCKQSSKLWYDTLRKYLKDIGFRQLHSEPCMFTKTNNGKNITIGIYTDDTIIAYNNKEDLEWFLKTLKKKFPFKMKDP